MEVPAKFRPVLVGFSYWLLAFIVLATSTFLVSCSGGGGTNTVTTVTTTSTTTVTPTVANSLTIINTPASVSVNGEVTITAFAKFNNKAVVGETIDFEITDNDSGSDLGAAIVSVKTGTNGQAKVTYTAGPTSGVTDTITVTSTNVQVTHDIDVNPLPAKDVTVIPTSEELPAIASTTGANRTSVEALVVDTGGQPIELLNVSFTTTAGTLCASGTAPAVACNATQPLVAQTDADGKAYVILQSSTNLGTATVTAQTPNLKTGTTDVKFIAGPAGVITLVANPSNITADNGNSTSEITALVTDTEGHIIADTDNQIVTFEIIAGGTAGIIGGLGDLLLLTDSDTAVGGLASTTYRTVGFTTGTVDIRATAGNATLDKADLITLAAQTVNSISLSFSPSDTLKANGTDWIEVKATVLDTNQNPVNAQTVTFVTTGGILDTDSTFPTLPTSDTRNAVTDASGIAIVYLQSDTVAGQYFVSATSSSKVALAPVNFVAGLADAGKSDLTISPDTIPANGSSTATLTLVALDANDNPVVDTTDNVTFITDAGGFVTIPPTVPAPDPLPQIINASTTGGVAQMTIVSSFVPTSVGGVSLEAQIDGITLNETMTFDVTEETNPNTIALALSGTTMPIESPAGSASIIITATVNDSTGDPIEVDCPDNIEFAIIAGPTDVMIDGIDSGSFPVVKTTANGVATASLTAGTTPGTVRVKVSVTKDISCGSLTPVTALTTPISIASGPAAIINLFPESKVIDIPLTSFTGQIFNAHVKDAVGNPVQEGTAIRFYLAHYNEGDVCPWGETGRSISEVDPSCSDDSVVINGVARTMLSYAPSFIWGTYTLYAETEGGGVTATYDGADAVYLAVEGVNITVAISPPTVPAGTVSPDITVSATYLDGSTNPGANPLIGRTLTFTSDNPGIADFDASPGNESVTDSQGKAINTTLDTTGSCIPTTNVTLRATEGEYTGSAVLTVTGNVPTASFVTSGSGADFTFTSNSTSGVGTITSCTWDLGDGSASFTDTPCVPVAYDYTSGPYGGGGTATYPTTVTLDVTNSEGCSDVTSTNISVSIP